MRSTTIALAAALLCGAAAAALAQNAPAASAVSPQDAARNVPTLSPSAPEVQNPLVNPSAAGTQRSWRGYGASSGATAERPIGSDNSGLHPGPDNAGSVTPGAGKPIASPAISPSAGRATTPAEARQRLKELGYSGVTELHRTGSSGWVAVARKGNNRQVRVRLDTEGDVVGER